MTDIGAVALRAIAYGDAHAQCQCHVAHGMYKYYYYELVLVV